MGILQKQWGVWLLALVLLASGCVGSSEWIREQGERGASVVDGVIVEPWGEIDGE